MKQKSINRKILVNIILVSVASLVLLGSISVVSVFQQSKMSEDALISQTKATMCMQVVDKVVNIDERLSASNKKVEYFSNFLNSLYKEAYTLPRITIPLNNLEKSNKKRLRMLLNEDNYNRYPQLPKKVKSEMLLLGNIKSAFTSNRDDMEDVTSVYLASEFGYAYMFDDYTDTVQNYEVTKHPWYIAAKREQQTFWTDPYLDAFTGGISLTCASPFYDNENKFRGVVALDYNASKINTEIIGVDNNGIGYAFAIDRSGNYMASKDLKPDKNGEFSLVSAYKDNQSEYNAEVDSMIAGNTDFAEVSIDGVVFYMAYAPIKSTGWSMAIVVPKVTVIAPAKKASEHITTLGLGLMAVSFIIISILISVLSKRVSEKISDPIIELQEAVENYVSGDLEFENKISTGDEIESLGRAFEKASLDVKRYIDDLASVTAEKERIGAELDIATKIQRSMLPSIFPAFPMRDEFDLYATMVPAKEVGGDFYDLFLIDEDHLCVVMADVSGKGVPAALFMVIAKTLIKNQAQLHKTPKEIFELTNEQLCESNETGMFVTAFLGVLEISTSSFTYVNAGHNPPLIKKLGGDFEWLETRPGFVLAGIEGMAYRQDEIRLGAGDLLYMYTDGVTEAVNCDEALFTEARLLANVNQLRDYSLRDLLESIKRDIDEFAGGAEQADDITMLALKIN